MLMLSASVGEAKTKPLTAAIMPNSAWEKTPRSLKNSETSARTATCGAVSM